MKMKTALASILLALIFGLSTFESYASCNDSYRECLEDSLERYEESGNGGQLYQDTQGCDYDLALCYAYGFN